MKAYEALIALEGYKDSAEKAASIYDLYKLLSEVVLDDALKALVKEVREERKTHERCYTAQDGYNIPSILQRIVDEKIYQKDYEDITERVLFDRVPYEEAIGALEAIIASGVFEAEN